MRNNSNQFGKEPIKNNSYSNGRHPIQSQENTEIHSKYSQDPQRRTYRKVKGNKCRDFFVETFFDQDHILGLKCCGRKRRLREYLHEDESDYFRQRLSRGAQSMPGNSQQEKVTFGKTQRFADEESRIFDAPAQLDAKKQANQERMDRLNPEMNGQYEVISLLKAHGQDGSTQKRQKLGSDVQNLNLIIQRQQKQIQSLLQREKEVSLRNSRGQPSPFQINKNQASKGTAQKDTRPTSFREMTNKVHNRMKFYEGAPKFMPPSQRDFSQTSNHNRRPVLSANTTSAHNLMLNAIDEDSRIDITEDIPMNSAPKPAEENKLDRIQRQIDSQNLLLIKQQKALQINIQDVKTKKSQSILKTDIKSIVRKNPNYTKVPPNSQNGDEDMDEGAVDFPSPERGNQVGRNMPRMNAEVVERKRRSKFEMTQIHQCENFVVNKIAHQVRCKLQYAYGHKIRIFAFDDLKGQNNWAYFEEMEKRHLKDVEGYLILNTMRNDLGKNIGLEINLVDKIRIFKNRLSFDDQRSSLLPSSPESMKYKAEVKEVLSKVFQMMQQKDSGTPQKAMPYLGAEVIVTGTNPIFALVCVLYQYVLAPKSGDNFRQVFNQLSKAKSFDEVLSLVKDTELTEYWTYSTLNLLLD